MGLKQQIDADLKSAMLAGDKDRSTTLRGLKSVILNAEIAASKRNDGLSDPEIISVLQKESKRRQESADLYKQGGSQDRADQELAEKAIIESYLPAQASEEEITAAVDAAISELSATDVKMMGQVINKTRESVGANADGATIARIVKERLT